MEVTFTNLFNKDLAALRDSKTAEAVANAISDVKSAASLKDIRNIKKLKGSTHHYRIRVGQYRLGLFVQDGVVEFSRFLHRKEVYRYFP